MESLEPRLFPVDDQETAGFLAHLSWRNGEGWRLYVTSWAEGQLPTSGHQETYTRLTASECLDVLAAEVSTRCPWARV